MPESRLRPTTTLPIAFALVLGLSACGSSTSDGSASAQGQSEAPKKAEKITVETNQGAVQIPAAPTRVVALDNTSFQTLQAFGITPVAVPKPLLPAEAKAWADDSAILDAGSHREPKLEAINQAQPDLIIGGKRFEKAGKDLQKIAPVIDLAPDTDKPGYVAALKKQTSTLGDIFGKKTQADQLNAALDASVSKAAAASKNRTVFLANHNGGKIDNGAGRLAPLLQPLSLKDVFATQANSESVHADSGLAPETVAQKNPDVMIVMDRDAATAKAGQKVTPASQTVKAQSAWKNTTFVKNDDIVYLAPSFYVTEGIQAYTDAYDKIAKTLSS